MRIRYEKGLFLAVLFLLPNLMKNLQFCNVLEVDHKIL